MLKFIQRIRFAVNSSSMLSVKKLAMELALINLR